MKKIKFGDFGDFKGAEIIDTVIGGGGNFRLERILSKSSASADGFWYDQPEFEFALVLDGFAELESESGGFRPILSTAWLELRRTACGLQYLPRKCSRCNNKFYI